MPTGSWRRLGVTVEHDGERRDPDLGVMLHELRYGVELLPVGRRRADLSAQIDQMLAAMPVLAYDATAAQDHGVLRAQARADGREPSAEYGQIAARSGPRRHRRHRQHLRLRPPRRRARRPLGLT
ncbi:MAG: hypothetical protein FWE61_06550 [Micrococcales bacterium]|nr:hypothetical protein [Micrococcales bacterium]